MQFGQLDSFTTKKVLLIRLYNSHGFGEIRVLVNAFLVKPMLQIIKIQISLKP